MKKKSNQEIMDYCKSLGLSDNNSRLLILYLNDSVVRSVDGEALVIAEPSLNPGDPGAPRMITDATIKHIMKYFRLYPNSNNGGSTLKHILLAYPKKVTPKDLNIADEI